ncbi:hypothetical protein [Clostridium beijerinckii]|uniref:hypothetical protein n=1 Tax=Clostridium beijerinckii TaxID=1520 RepID=UPI0014948C07|nr:hypothetical protein [Clostridium beijerinckii]NOW03228.1 hypothetical protein [Clostridium beijerinckii]NYC03630.1 hypothetical protein [Clostridium beijerinckii]
MNFTDEQYEKMAIQAITLYKNKDYTDDETRNLYPLAIPIVIENIKKSLKMDKNVSSETVGDESRTYNKEDLVIDDIVKMIIGVPYVRFY